jgi:hypothetical protein
MDWETRATVNMGHILNLTMTHTARRREYEVGSVIKFMRYLF